MSDYTKVTLDKIEVGDIVRELPNVPGSAVEQITPGTRSTTLVLANGRRAYVSHRPTTTVMLEAKGDSAGAVPADVVVDAELVTDDEERTQAFARLLGWISEDPANRVSALGEALGFTEPRAAVR